MVELAPEKPCGQSLIDHLSGPHDGDIDASVLDQIPSGLSPGEVNGIGCAVSERVEALYPSEDGANGSRAEVNATYLLGKTSLRERGDRVTAASAAYHLEMFRSRRSQLLRISLKFRMMMARNK
jgi:hypothetical protein